MSCFFLSASFYLVLGRRSKGKKNRRWSQRWDEKFHLLFSIIGQFWCEKTKEGLANKQIYWHTRSLEKITGVSVSVSVHVHMPVQRHTCGPAGVDEWEKLQNCDHYDPFCVPGPDLCPRRPQEPEKLITHTYIYEEMWIYFVYRGCRDTVAENWKRFCDRWPLITVRRKWFGV